MPRRIRPSAAARGSARKRPRDGAPTRCLTLLLGILSATTAAAVVLAPELAEATTPQTAPIYGITIDRVTGIAKMIAAERTLPERPTTRVYFGATEPPGYYLDPVKQLHAVSSVMGELLDSSDATGVSPAAYQARVESYLATLGPSVDIWEIGNEVNGSWTGPYAAGSAKIQEAYTDVAAAGGASALTLYANEYAPNNCGDGGTELTPVQYSNQYVPASVRDGIDYVFESYYPTQCASTYPSNAEVAVEMTRLHALYPHALLGFGEVGLPHPAKPKTLAAARQVMSWAYGLHPGVAGYVGGYFWWYGRQDVLAGKRLLASSFATALRSEAAALG